MEKSERELSRRVSRYVAALNEAMKASEAVFLPPLPVLRPTPRQEKDAPRAA
jgi:hypothetical protein